jgi:hypothetical protein
MLARKLAGKRHPSRRDCDDDPLIASERRGSLVRDFEDKWAVSRLSNRCQRKQYRGKKTGSPHQVISDPACQCVGQYARNEKGPGVARRGLCINGSGGALSQLQTNRRPARRPMPVTGFANPTLVPFPSILSPTPVSGKDALNLSEPR